MEEIWLPEQGKEYFIDCISIDEAANTATIAVDGLMVDAFETQYPSLVSKIKRAVEMGRELPFAAKAEFMGFDNVAGKTQKIFSLKIK